MGYIGRVYKQNLIDLDQSRPISSVANRPFTNYLRAVHSAFIKSGAKTAIDWILIQFENCDKRTTLSCLHFIGVKYHTDQFCYYSGWHGLVPSFPEIAISTLYVAMSDIIPYFFRNEFQHKVNKLNPRRSVQIDLVQAISSRDGFNLVCCL